MPDIPRDAEDTGWRMRAIADELSLAGLDTRLHESRACIDVTATIHPGGHREIEAIVDEDACIELRFWHGTDATPAQVAAMITSAVSAITAAQHPGAACEPRSGTALHPPHRGAATPPSLSSPGSDGDRQTLE